MVRAVSTRAVGVALLGGLALAACGKKGPPLPPVPLMPEAGAAVQILQEGNGIRASAPVPERYLDGRRLAGVREARLYRILRPTGTPVAARDFPLDLAPVAVIEGPEAESLAPGGEARFAEPLPDVPAGRVLYYAARFLADGKRWSAPSAISRPFTPGAAPAAPTGLTAAYRREGVELSWQPAPDTVALGVYRSIPVAREPLVPTIVLPGTTERWIDEGVRDGDVWVYRLRALSTDAPHAVASPAAGPVQVTIADRFAPAPPQGLELVPRADGMDLFWELAPEPDVAGYIVWRRDEEQPDAEWERLTPEPVPQSWFTDRTAPAGRTLSWSISAVDRATPPNEGRRGAPRVFRRALAATPAAATP